MPSKSGTHLEPPAGVADPRRASAARKSRDRRAGPEERQEAILRAALDVFSEHGFAAARLDDVAQRAGVAKGTLYLYFADKETLFERMLQSVAAPGLALLARLAAEETVPPAEALSALLAFFEKEVLGTPREKVIRLIVAEGPRFPRLAKFYYDEVVSKGIASIRAIAAREKHGAFDAEALSRFPQLIFAPLLMSVIWRSLFSRFEPLDVSALLAAHKNILLHKQGERDP
jgi:AcrR family transcriptional regulator